MPGMMLEYTNEEMVCVLEIASLTIVRERIVSDCLSA